MMKKKTASSIIRKIIAILICFYINWLGSFLLYDPVMDVFNIDTAGFMNLNGVLTATVIWMLIAIILLVTASFLKERLGAIYKTVRTTQKVFLLLPIILFIVFLFAASLK